MGCRVESDRELAFQSSLLVVSLVPFQVMFAVDANSNGKKYSDSLSPSIGTCVDSSTRSAYGQAHHSILWSNISHVQLTEISYEERCTVPLCTPRAIS
jgi:hypothetical protein